MTLRDMAVGDKGISITRYAPMGDPVEISVRGFALSMRKDEAAALLVEKVEK